MRVRLLILLDKVKNLQSIGVFCADIFKLSTDSSLLCLDISLLILDLVARCVVIFRFPSADAVDSHQ